MSDRSGLHDPDDWIGWWLSLHPSDLFHGELAHLAVDRLREEPFPEGLGSVALVYTEGDQRSEVEVTYVLERFPKGRIFHVLSIRSDGDPLPPFADR